MARRLQASNVAHAIVSWPVMVDDSRLVGVENISSTPVDPKSSSVFKPMTGFHELAKKLTFSFGYRSVVCVVSDAERVQTRRDWFAELQVALRVNVVNSDLVS